MVFAKRDTILGKWQLFDTCISLGSECVLKEIKEGIITEYIAVWEYLYSNTDQVRGVLPFWGWGYEMIEIQTNSAGHAILDHLGIKHCGPIIWFSMWTIQLISMHFV